MKNKKIILSIYGSISHYNDWKMLTNIWKKISSDIEIRNKCKLKIIGYVKGDKYWEEIISIFKINNFEVEIVNSANPDNYMDLLKDVNIFLAPLEDNQFNEKKSGLKILEASINRAVLISTPVYAKKQDFSGYIMAKKIGDWYKIIKNLIKQNEDGEYEFEKVGKVLSEINIKDNKFDYRLEKIKVGIQQIFENPYKLDENLKVYSIIYNDEQICAFEPYDNSHIKTREQKSYLFESNPIIDIIDNYKFKDEDYVGIFSHKFTEKTHIGKKLLNLTFSQVKDSQYDIIGLSPSIFHNNYLDMTEKYHPGFTELFIRICDDLGLEIKEPKNPIFSNFFLAKYPIYKEFVNNILKPAIGLLEDKYSDLAWRNANYLAGLSKEKLLEVSGLEYYPFHTFIIERLLSVWIESRNDLKFLQVG